MSAVMHRYFSWTSVRIWAFLFAAALFLAMGAASSALAAQAPVPAFTSQVIDTTQTLDAATRTQLTQQLAALEQRKGAQIAVLMVPTTGDESIEQYATRAFEQWKVGRKKVDDGILLVVAKNDRKLRIEVGYGLEGAVPDLLAGRIIREQIAPSFKQGDFAAGVVKGVDSLVKLVDGEELPPVPVSGTANGEGSDDDAPFGMLLPLAFFAMVIPALPAGLITAVFVYLMFNSLGFAVLGGIAGFVVSLIGRGLRAGGRGSSARASRRGGVIGGIGGGLGGGMGGFGGGGGGFGGGGFGGGGGGGSGGGGASGGW